MQETWVRSLVLEDPTCLGATKPVYHSYWACALEPRSHNFWSLCGLEPMFCNKRSHCTATTLAATREKPVQHWRPRAAKNKSINKKNRLCTQSHMMLSKFFFLIGIIGGTTILQGIVQTKWVRWEIFKCYTSVRDSPRFKRRYTFKEVNWMD